MTDDEIIAVVHALREGRIIQARSFDGAWYNLEHSVTNQIRFNFLTFDYRVAPEPRKPREWMIYVKGGGSVSPYPDFTNEPVRVREVIE